MPINFDALRQAQLDQAAAEFFAERNRPPTIGDFGRSLGVGVADIPTSIGEGLSLLGLEAVGGAVRGFGEDVQESLVEGMTLGGRRAATAPILESDTPIATTALKALQTLPGVAAMAIPGAGAVRALGAVGRAGRIAPLAPQALETGAQIPSKLAVGLGFGASEGVYSGLSNAAQTRGEIMNQDIETLAENPLYQKHFSTLDPALADADRQQLAREAASREAEMDVFVKTTLTTGIISATGGGGVFAALARPTAGIGKEFVKGAVAEAATEAPQSALEQVHQNVALNRPTTEGALTAATEGGIIGGLLGGGIGGINAAFTVPGTTQADIDAGVLPAVAPPVAPPVMTVAPKAFTDMSPEETVAAARAALAEAALRQAGVQAQARVAGQFPTLFPRNGNTVPFAPPVAAPLTTSLGAGPEPLPSSDPIGVDRYAFAGLDRLVPKDTVVEKIDFEPVARPELTTTLGAQPPASPPRADQIGVGRFSFVGLEGLETPEAATARIATLQAQGAPRSAEPKLPKSFRGKTVAEFEAELETSTLSAKTVAKAEAYLNTVLRPQAQAQSDELTRLQEVVNPAPEVVNPTPTTPSVAEAVVPITPVPPAGVPDYVAAPHQAQYTALRAEALDAGIAPETVEQILRQNYDPDGQVDAGATQGALVPRPEIGFDSEEVRNDITATRLGQPTFRDADQLPPPPKRGRPTKEQQAERAAVTTAASVPASVMTDPDPDVQGNARAIVADSKKLAQLRQMATEPDAHPLTLRLKKAADELLSAASQPIPVSSRPAALGPNYLGDDEELAAWGNLRAEFVAAGVKPDEAEAILARNYDPTTGFDTDVLAAELQGAEQGRATSRTATDDLTAAIVSGQPAANPKAQRLAMVKAAAERIQKQWKRPPFGGVQVHETIATLPQGLQNEVYSQNAQRDVRGIYDPATGTVHLIASHLATPEEAQFVLFHEVLGHFGLRGFLGQNFGATMRDLYKRNQNLRRAANALRKEFKYDLETATEEALADMAGRNLPIKGFAALLAKIQKALRAIGLDSVANWMESRTNAEVLNVIAQAKLFVTEGKGASHIYTPTTAKLLYSYAGPRATQANLRGLVAAEQFETLGIPKAQIRATTGWFRGPDEKWRFEISDRGAALAPTFDTARTIGEVLYHPLLFTNYPTLRDVPFRWQDLPSDDQAKVTNLGRIIVNSRLDDATALSAILHELQHVVQAAEGFARGGTTTTPEVVEAASKAGGTPQALFEVYQHLAGEIEARDVQARALMTDAERALNEPFTSEALTRAPIIRFGGSQDAALTAYHASPHTFDRFSTRHIGKGQGAQAFGWGLYFATSKDVLDHYHQLFGGMTSSAIASAEKRAAAIEGFASESRKDIAKLERRVAALERKQIEAGHTPESDTLLSHALTELSRKKRALAHEERTAANIYARISRALSDPVPRYEVDLAPQEDEYLVWDATVDGQSAKVQQALRQLDPNDELGRLRGAQVYTAATKRFGSRKSASLALRAAGVRGIKYFDGNSRTANYVVFDEADVSITSRFSRAGQDAAEGLSAQVGEFYNVSAPFQRAFRKLAAFGSKSSAVRAVRLALSRSVASPYHIAASGVSKGYTNLFQNVLRPMQQFSDYIMSTLQEPIQRTWVQGQGLGKPPAHFEAAARALFAHNDSGVPMTEFFNDPQYAANLDPKARELYDQVRETIKRGLNAEFTAKAIRMQEVINDPTVYAETIQELYELTQQRIDRGFIPNRRHGEYAIGAYHADTMKTDTAGNKYFTGQPMQWYTFESIGEAQSAAKELRTLFQGQSDIVLDIDAIGNGQPTTVERAANDRYSTSAYWDFLAQAQESGIKLSDTDKGRLAKLMIRGESMLQNKIQRRRGVPGYSKDLMRTLGEFITSTGFSVAQTQMSARTTSAMNKRFFLSEAELTELGTLRARFEDVASVSESKVYETLTQEPNLMKRFEALNAYGRMKYLEVSGGQFWAQDGVDKGAYRDRANELINFLKSPKSGWAEGVRSLAALHFLGGSVASAVVNLSSLPMFAAPYLHQYIGAKAYPLLTKHFRNFTTHPALRDLPRLAAALDPQQRTGSGQAAQDWKSLEPLGEDLLIAVQRAAEEGIISDSQIHELFGFARGGLLAHSSAVRKGISAWMTPFRLTEQANRFSTFMAAFEAGKKGITVDGVTKTLTGAELYTFARDAVDQTQAIYGPINRQPWARTSIGHALFTFRAFPLMMSELWLRLPAPQRTLALGSLVLAAGINGIPFADDLRDIIDTIAQRVFGEPLNTRRTMTNMVAQASESALGVDLSRLIMNGSLDALTGASISGRIGFGNLIPGTRIGAAGEDFFSRTLADIAGPVGAEVHNFAKAFQGQPAALLPSAVRNIGKAVEAARYGKITDPRGQTLIDDVTAAETFMQGLGFSSGRLSQAYETQRGIFQEQAYVEEVREGFLNDIRTAVVHNDTEALSDVREEVTAWNESHPQWPITMRPSQLRSTLKLAGLPLTERTLKLLPRAWRGAIDKEVF